MTEDEILAAARKLVLEWSAVGEAPGILTKAANIIRRRRAEVKARKAEKAKPE